jgi:phage/plasmid-associated DNA primase
VAAFFPPAAVIRANLSHICNNIFEAANLRNRTLVILNDIDEYPGKLSILKSLSGGESIRSQIKYAQESVAVEPTFSFLVTANQTFRLKSDAGGAIARRLLNIAFPHACPPEARKNLV